MSMMVSFVLSFFPRDVLDEILNLIESVSEDFLTTLTIYFNHFQCVVGLVPQAAEFDLISHSILCQWHFYLVGEWLLSRY